MPMPFRTRLTRRVLYLKRSLVGLALAFGQFALIAYAVEVVPATGDSFTSQPDVRCLDQQSAKRAISDDSADNYFGSLQLLEIAALTKQPQQDRSLDAARDFARTYFGNSTRDFSADEVAALTWLIGELHTRLERYTYFLKRPWSIIKVQRDLCGGFSFTRGEQIVLGERNLQTLVRTRRTDPAEALRRYGSLLVHERMHVLQRVDADRFKPLFQDLLGWHAGVVAMHPDFDRQQIANPDGQDENWFVRLPMKPESSTTGDRPYWLGTILNSTSDRPQMGADFANVAVPLFAQADGSFQMQTDPTGHVIMQPFAELPELAEHFPFPDSWEHPNEMSARLTESLVRPLLNLASKEDALDTAEVLQSAATDIPRTADALLWLDQHLRK